MLALKTLIITNFLSIQSATVDFRKAGLYLITGYNQIGGDSNGCGKSTILAAIAFALWGKTPGGLRGSDVANWDSTGDYCVELTLDGPEGAYRICRKVDSLELSINGKVLSGRKTDVQELINETFHSSYDIFFSSTLFTSDMSDYLTKMGDADKKRLFKSVIGLEALDRAYAKVKALYDVTSTDATNLQQQIMLTTDFIDARRQEVETIKYQYDRYEEDRQEKIDNLNRQTIEKLEIDPNLIFRIRSLEITLQKAEANIPKTQIMIEHNETTTREYYEKLGGIRQSIVNFEHGLSEANSLEGNANCDKCGSKLGSDYGSHIAHLQEDLKTAKRTEFDLLESIGKLETELRTFTSFITSTDKLRSEVEELHRLLAVQDEEVRKQEEFNSALETRIQETRDAVNPYDDFLITVKADFADKTNKLAVYSEEFKTMTTKMDHLAFLKIVFSREGVAAQIIEKAFGRLESLSNKYLTKICSEGLLLNITPQRELKSKALKEEIDIFVTSKHSPNRKIPFAALSGGQKQRINIALLLSLYKFCRELGKNEFDFIILDEILDLSLAAKGQEDVVNLLRDLLQEVSQIIVVSHKEGISHDFDYEIQVNRDVQGISHISQ